MRGGNNKGSRPYCVQSTGLGDGILSLVDEFQGVHLNGEVGYPSVMRPLRPSISVPPIMLNCQLSPRIHSLRRYDFQDEEPRKKRATRKMDTGEESRSDDDEDYSLPAAAGSAREEEGVGAGKDEADEEEWNEQSVETTGGAGAGSDGEEAAGSGVSRRKKEKRGKKARRRADDTPSRQDVPSKKKRAPRWTKEVRDTLDSRTIAHAR